MAMNQQKRKELLAKIGEVIGEQVESFVFVCLVEDDEEIGESRVMHTYHGGRVNALGLLKHCELDIEESIRMQ
jgi:hypothetical protein